MNYKDIGKALKLYDAAIAKVYNRDESKVHVYGFGGIEPLSQFPVKTTKIDLHYQLGNSNVGHEDTLVEKVVFPENMQKRNLDRKNKEIEFINNLSKQSNAKGLKSFPNTVYLPSEDGSYVCYQTFAGDYSVFELFPKYSSPKVKDLEKRLSESDVLLDKNSLSKEELKSVEELRGMKRVVYEDNENQIKLKSKFVQLHRGKASEYLPGEEERMNVFKNCFHTIAEFNEKMTSVWSQESQYKDVGIFRKTQNHIKRDHGFIIRKINPNLGKDVYKELQNYFNSTLSKILTSGPETFIQGDGHGDNLVIGKLGNNYKIEIVDLEHIKVVNNPLFDLVRCGNFLERSCEISEFEKKELWDSVYDSKENNLTRMYMNLQGFTEFFDDFEIYGALNKRVRTINHKIKEGEYVEYLTHQSYDYWRYSIPKIRKSLLDFTTNWERKININSLDKEERDNLTKYFHLIKKYFLPKEILTT